MTVTSKAHHISLNQNLLYINGHGIYQNMQH